MSWQAYADNLVATGTLSKAGLFGHNGAPWAVSAGFGCNAAEGAKIAGLFSTAGKAFSDGIHIEGKKYLAVKADERSIYGKLGAGGCVIVKTKQAILIATYGEGHQPGAAANSVEKIADYLIEQGY